MQLPPEQEAIRAKCFLPSGTFVEFPKEEIEQSVPERFEKIVRMYPDRLAVKMGDRSLTYDELNRYASRIGRAVLAKRGPGSEPIMLLYEHGIDVIAAILGVLKAGKFYVALDPSFSQERIKYILQDSGAALILTNKENVDDLRPLTEAKPQLFNIDEIDATNVGDNLGVSLSPRDFSGLIYTSGSTGVPKGVVVTHAYHLNYAWVFSNEAQVSPEDRLSLVHSLGFASAMVNLVRALLNGSSLFPFDFKTEGVDRLAKWLRDERITIFHSPPALFRQMIDIMGGTTFPDLRIIDLSGAPITAAEFDAYRRISTGRTRLEFQMGSTEAGTITSALVDGQFPYPTQGVPIGYACPGRQISLLDESGHEVNHGDVGEIAVKGRHMAAGYWNDPDLTKDKFLPDPSGADERIFLTGDLGQMTPDGLLMHRGRKDFMVKIRGFRVEIGEIERALISHPLIKDVGIVALEREVGEKYLGAYVVPRTKPGPRIDDLRAFLSDRLPDYMMPSAFVFLDSLPLTNGKLDRTALPKPEGKRPEVSQPYVAPRSEVEQELVRMWDEILDVRPIGIHDNFFDLGGHSLSASRVLSRAIKTFQVDLPLSAVFDSPTVAEMAAIITESQANQASEAELAEMLREVEVMTDADAQWVMDNIDSTIAKK